MSRRKLLKAIGAVGDAGAVVALLFLAYALLFDLVPALLHLSFHAAARVMGQ